MHESFLKDREVELLGQSIVLTKVYRSSVQNLPPQQVEEVVGLPCLPSKSLQSGEDVEEDSSVCPRTAYLSWTALVSSRGSNGLLRSLVSCGQFTTHCVPLISSV